MNFKGGSVRNSDKVNHVGYTTGIAGIRGDFGTKVRFMLGEDTTARMKELSKMGATDMYFVELPEPMTKAEALRFMQARTDAKFTAPEVQRAMAHAAKRILVTAKTKTGS